MYSYNVCIRKEENSKVNALISHLKKLRKRTNKAKSKKNAIKVRVEINKMKNK